MRRPVTAPYKLDETSDYRGFTLSPQPTSNNPYQTDTQPYYHERILVAVILGIVIGVLLILHTASKNFNIDTTTLGLVGLLIVVASLPFVQSLTFAGNTLTFTEKLAQPAVEKVKNTLQSPKSSPERIPGLRQHVRHRNLLEIVKINPKYALGGAREGIESSLVEVAELANVPRPQLHLGIRPLSETLVQQKVLQPAEADAIQSLTEVLDQAAHFRTVEHGAAVSTISASEQVLTFLDEKAKQLRSGTIKPELTA